MGTDMLQRKCHHQAIAGQTLRIRTPRTTKAMSFTVTNVERGGLWWTIHRGNFQNSGGRYQEHLKEPSPIHVHNLQTGHCINPDNFNTLGREDQGLTRLIKESIYIRVNNPTLNRNIGKFNLSHIWERVLLNTPGLEVNNNKGQMQAQGNIPIQPICPIGKLQGNIGHSEHALN